MGASITEQRQGSRYGYRSHTVQPQCSHVASISSSAADVPLDTMSERQPLPNMPGIVSAGRESSPPSVGPPMKPMPMKVPSAANALPVCSLGVMSLIMALAMVTLALSSPPMARHATAYPTLLLSPKSTCDVDAAISPTYRTGLRP